MGLIGVPSLALEVGMDIIPLIDPGMGGDLMDRIIPMRVEIAKDLGFIMPGCQFKDNMDLRPDCYVIKVRGNVVAEGELMIGYHLAVETPDSEAPAVPMVGFPTTDPAFGRPAIWVTRAEGAKAAKLGFEVMDATQVLAMHVDEVVRAHAHEILSLEELATMLDRLREKHPQTIECVLPEKLDLADYHLILKNLLKERVSVRDQVTILERLAHAAKPVHPFYLSDKFGESRASIESIMLMEMSANIRPLNDPTILTESVRVALSRQICASLASSDQTLDVILLDGSVEQVILDGIQTSSTGQSLVLSPARRELLTNRLSQECNRMERPIVLCDPRIRPFVKQLLTRAAPRVAVLSHAELHPQYRVQSVGTVSLVES
jgi:flagellar biosynthesis protein FlhA